MFFVTLIVFCDSLDFIFIVMMIFITTVKCSINTCERTSVDDGGGVILYWAETPALTSRPSSPYCVNSDDIQVERKCLENGIWEDFDPRVCKFYSLEKFTGCPNEAELVKLNNGKKLCIYVSTPKKWGNECIKFGSLKSILEFSSDEMMEVLHYIHKQNTNFAEFWLPLRRNQQFHPFIWQTFGSMWSHPLELNTKITLQDDYINRCLKFTINNTNNVVLKSENCLIQLPEICLIEYDENILMEMGCTSGYTSKYADFQDSCFEIEKTSSYPKFKLFDITRKYSTKFLNNLMSSKKFKLDNDDKCLIDFHQDDFFNKTYGNYPVIDRNGKWFMSKSYNCIIYEKSVDLQVPILDLKFDTFENRLLLAIYSEESLWKSDSDFVGVKCFTSSSNEFTKSVKIRRKVWKNSMQLYLKLLGNSRLQSKQLSKTIYQLKVDTKGAAVYWCEGHMAKTMKFIRSKNAIAKIDKNDVTITMSLESKINVTNDPVYSRKSLEKITTQLKSILHTTTSLEDYERFIVERIEDIYIMRIMNYDEIESRVTAVYHVVISRKQQSSSEEDSYEDFMEKYADKFDDSKFIQNPLQLVANLNVIMSKLTNDNFILHWIHSTDYCLSISEIKSNFQLSWEPTVIGQRMPPRELCLRNNGMPLTRKCEGNFIVGGRWEKLSDKKSECVDEKYVKAHTKSLYNMNDLNVNVSARAIESMTTISSHVDQLIPADLFYISKAMRDLSSSLSVNVSSYDNFDLENTSHNLTIILNNVMNVNEKFIQLSQLQLNTTNILLDSYDNLINSLSTTNYSIYNNNNIIKKSSNETDDGTFVIQSEKIIVFFCSPEIMNVSGLALVKRNQSQVVNESLMDFQVAKLYSHQSPDDVLSLYQDSLEIASFFPSLLLDQIKNSTQNLTTPLRIVIKVFYDDKMFKENAEITTMKAQSKIISVTIPNIPQDLPSLLPIIFRKPNDATNGDACGYWDFQPDGPTSNSSEWLRMGCELTGTSTFDKDLVVCGCSHMTHFAYLIAGTYIHDHNQDVVITPLHSEVLNTITLFGSALSILGILGIFITAACFKSWREKNSSKVLLQLSIAIMLQMILFVFFSTEKSGYSIDTASEKNICITLGASLHYSVLVTFSWMLITAFLQFKRYVVVLGNIKPERFFLKASIIGWGMPFVPVLALLVTNPYLYIPEEQGICYPQGIAFYLGILLPVGLIVIANLIVFIMVIHNILKSGPTNLRKTERGMIISQVRVSIFLFFLLGLTWIFGFIASSRAAILFSYLFCLTATIQGFVLFIYFIIMDPITRKLWSERSRTWNH